MSSKRPPQLILTGGTLCSLKDSNNRMRPEATAEFDHALKEAGFDFSTALFPYNIDSINFDMGKDYPRLCYDVMQSLDAGNTPVVCGGTDTLTWYSAMLTKDLQRRGYLQKGSGQKVIFLSSMYSIQENPEHVNIILQAGKLFVDQKASGGFAICAEGKDAKVLQVHDVTNHFDKISGSEEIPFRSSAIFGRIEEGLFMPNLSYRTDQNKPSPLPVSSEHEYARIAPPLLAGHDDDTMLSYLKAMGEAKPPFDGVIIEGVAQAHNQQALVETVRWLSENGTRVVFCHPVRAADGQMLPVKRRAEGYWHPEDKKALQQAGAKFVTSQPKDLYMDMALTITPQPDKKMPALDKKFAYAKQTLGIRYVPHDSVMKQTIRTVAPWTKTMLFSALVNGVMGDGVSPALAENKDRIRFLTGHEYNDLVTDPQSNRYKAGERSEAFTQRYYKDMNSAAERVAALDSRRGIPCDLPATPSFHAKKIRRSDPKVAARIKGGNPDSRNPA